MIPLVIPKQHMLHSFFFGWLYGVGAVKVGGYVSEFQIKFSYFHELRYRFSRKAENFYLKFLIQTFCKNIMKQKLKKVVVLG